jgi:TetR/AcrR family transcriptional regulator, transcriptional repressor of aconitase
MPRVSTNQLAARRQQILDGARASFSRHGYEGATVRRLEQATGLSRGAIFHHFRDKEALFLALAEQDAQRMVEVVVEQGLVQVMRELLASPESIEAGWTGTFLEIARRTRTDPGFRERWRERSGGLAVAIRGRLERQAAAGALRTDVPVGVLASYLELVLDGLLARLATGAPDRDDVRTLDAVLDLVEGAVRVSRPARPGAS